MQFIRSEGTSELEIALSKGLGDALDQSKPVLWLIPGGSNIAIVIKVMANLDANNLSNLTLVLTDERFGPPGHKDSNYFQFMQNGLELRGATFADLLDGDDFEATISASSNKMAELFASHQNIIGFFGMGADGHIAGILPHSPAAVGDEKWMIGYDAGQFKRFTLTPFALSHVNTAFLGAFGTEKLEALNNLKTKMMPITEQPAQILRHIPEAYIYNNQIGDVE